MYVQQLRPWISYVFYGNHKVLSACKAQTNLMFVFCLI